MTLLELARFEVGDRIHESPRSRVFRGTRIADGAAVIIKVRRDDYPSDDDVARFELAYEIGREVSCAHVIRYVALERVRNGLAIVTEDYGAVSLDRVLVEGEGMELRRVLDIAVAVAEALESIHGMNVVHKDITPGNIVMNFTTGEVKVIDFGISSRLSRENPVVMSPGQLEGTLPYVSPEQTGRMNRSVDYRSDFYSLGATLYQLACGRPPFPTQDAMELIHCHLARRPVPPCEVNPDIPETVSVVIMRLLAKRAEDRYLSAHGLRADLERCRRQLGEKGRIDPFSLGTEDASDRFRIPQKLYGRDADAEQLLHAFDEAAGGGRSMLLVAGYAGIGKSALIHEAYKPITEKRGRLCSGKFDQFRRDLPYYALAEALRHLVRQVLTEDAAHVEAVRRDLANAVEGNGRVLFDIVPELKTLLGEPPPVPDVGPTEALNRFNRVVRRFVRVFARADHPLTIFLDDLQWADLPTLQLMEVLITDPSCEYLFVIGAYRDNEVHSGHALFETVRRIEELGQPVRTITLGPFPREDVVELVADALRVEAEDARPLAATTYAKTGGNPFFVREFLETMYEEGHIEFVRKERRWTWDLPAIENAATTDNVVELVAAKLQKLPPRALALVQLASCIGSHFDLATLALVEDDSKAETAHALSLPLREGLIVPTDGAYKYAVTKGAAKGDRNASYRFLHDRVQQAAWSLMPPEERAAKHERIGWLRLEHTPPEALADHVIDIVNHLNVARDRIDETGGRRRLAALNLQAGQRARASMAAEPARNYLRAGLELLADDAWSSDYDLCLALHLAATDAEFLCQDFDAMERMASLVLTYARTLLDAVPAHDVRMRAYIARDEHERALDMALGLLDELGVKLPRNPGQLRVLMSILRTQLTVGRREPMELAELPNMTDPVKKAAMHILMGAVAPAYYLGSGLFPIMLCKMVEMSVRYGNVPASAQGYSGFAIINCSGLGKVERGQAFTEVAWAVMERFDAREQAAKLVLVAQAFIQHWRGPLSETPAKLMEGWRAGLEHGDMEYGVYCGLSAYTNSILSGRQLEPLDGRYEELLRLMRDSRQEQSVPLVATWRQLSACLRDPGLQEARLVGEYYDSEAQIPLYLERRNFTAVVHGRIAEAILAYLLADHMQACDRLESIEPHLESALGLVLVPTHHFFQALALCALARRDPAVSLKRVRRNLKRVKKWARDAPENYDHKIELLEAEIATVRGDHGAAIRHYRAAVKGAGANGFLHEEAIATERLGETYGVHGAQDLEDFYLIRARRLYAWWGAAAKVSQLERRSLRLAQLSEPTARTTAPLSTTVDAALDSKLDLESVTKAARILSGEIKLGPLLSRMTELAIENAGAERGALLLERGGELVVEAAGTVDDERAIETGVPLSKSPLPASIIEYARRTGESVLLEDAQNDEMFGEDRYVIDQQPRSLLCAPIVQHGRSTGVMYLENNLSTGAFAEDRLKVLEILTAQAAISIENSSLFEQEQRQREAFARFVPHEFLEGLGRESIVDIVLGDTVEKEMTILFSNIRGSTTLMEAMAPAEAIEFINRYLSHMEPIIKANSGFVDAYIGDAIMALFGTGAETGVAAAVAMLRELSALNDERRASSAPEIAVGIGLNTGPLTMGTIGGPTRIKCGVIGGAVNLAARVESLTKRYAIPLLITDRTFERLGSSPAYHTRLVDKVRVAGKSEPVTVYEVFDADPAWMFDAKQQVADAYREASRLYYQRDFSGALELFQRCASQLPDDSVIARYVERASRFQDHAPGKEWSGIELLGHK